MKHLWRNAWLLLAALLLLFTVTLAADGGDNPIGLRILEEKETISVTYISSDSSESYTYQEARNAGTMIWNHVDGARAYAITITKDGGEPVEHTTWQNTFSLNGAIEESGSYQLRVAALDAQEEEISGKSAAIIWTYTMPSRIPTPSITVEGAVGTISLNGSSSLVDYYEIEFYQNGEFLGSTTTKPEEPRFSMPIWVYERVESSAPVTCCAVARSSNVLAAADSLKSEAVEIGLPPKASAVTGARILTEEETIQYIDNYGILSSQTLQPGSVVWDQRENENYKVSYYRKLEDGQSELIDWIWVDTPFYSLDQLQQNLATGTYYATIQVESKVPGFALSDLVETGLWSYVQPAPLATPTNLRWDGIWAVCDPVEGADVYAFRIYFRKSPQDAFQWNGETSYNNSPMLNCRFSFENFGNGEYYFTVSAVSNHILEAASSPYSEPSPTFVRDGEPLDAPTGFRVVTKEETITYEYNGRLYTDILYPGFLTWDWDERATEYYAEIYSITGGYYLAPMIADVGAFLDPAQNGSLPNGTYRITLQARDESGKAGSSPTVELTYTYNPTLTLATPQVTANGMHLTFTMPEGQEELVRMYIINQQITWEGGEEEYNWISDQPEFTVPDTIFEQHPDAQSTVSVQARSNNMLTYRDSGFSAPLALSAARLSTPTDLKWVMEDGNCTGAISFKVGETTDNKHWIQVYEQSRGEVYSMNIYYTPESDGTVIFDSTMKVFDAPGTYYFTVTSVPEDNSPYISSETATSETFVYTVENKLDAPANPVWNNVEACWEYPESVPEGNGYLVEWLVGDTPDTMRDYGGIWSDNSIDESESFPVVRLDPAIDQYIAFRVRVISANIMAACHSDWVQSETICIPAEVTGVWNALDQASGNLTQVQEDLKELQPAEVMQAWQMLGQEMERTIESIEMGKEISTNVVNESGEDDGSRVVGLLLSADDPSKDVTLTIYRRDLLADSVQLLDGAVTAANYRAATEVRFEAENVKDELVIPVQMKLTLPQNIQDVSRLQVLRADTMDPVPFTLAEEDGQTFVKFVMSDLEQAYVLAEANPLGEVTVKNDGTVTVTANAPGATLCAASYDANGQMLDVATASVTADETSYTLSLASAGASVRVFLLDQNQTPLCPAKCIGK